MKTILPALLTLIVGFAAGWLVFDQPSAELALGAQQPPTSTDTGKSRNLHQTKAQENSADPRAAEPNFDSPPPSKINSVHVDGEPNVEAIVKNALAGANIAPVEKGTGTITGTVKTKDGAPLAGVLIRAHQQTGGVTKEDDRPTPVLPDISDIARNAVIKEIERRAIMVEAMSKPDGSFRLDGIAAGVSYVVGGFRDGFEIRGEGDSPNPNIWNVTDGQSISFIGTPVAEVFLKVENPIGPYPVEVAISRKGAMATTRHVSPNGLLTTLEPGQWFVSARDYRNQRTAPTQEITIVPREGRQLILLTLADAPGVRVTLTKAGEADLRKTLHVSLREKVEDELVNKPDHILPLDVNFDGLVAIADLRTAPSSYFGLQKGKTYQVCASIDYPSRDSRGIEVLGEFAYEVKLHELSYLLSMPDTSALFNVSIEGPDGPVADVRASARVLIGDRYSPTSIGFNELEAGKYFLDATNLRELGRGYESEGIEITYTLEFRSKYGSKTMPLRFSGSQSISVVFEKPGRIIADVSGVNNEVHNGQFHMSIGPKQNGTRYSSQMQRDKQSNREEELPEGITEHSIVSNSYAPGSYFLQVTYSTRRTSRGSHEITTNILEREIELRSGDQRITVQAPLLVTLTVHDSNAPADAEMSIGSWTNKIKNDGNGNFIWANIPAGSYTVRKDYGGHENMNVDVPSNTTVEFKERINNAMRVEIKDPNGLLGQAGFQQDDIIIGAEDVYFETRQDAKDAVRKSQYGERAMEWIVRRNGSEIKITFDFSKVKDKESVGGSLSNASREDG